MFVSLGYKGFIKKHFFDAKLSFGARPRKLTSPMELFYVSTLTRRKVFTTREVTKHIHEVFGVQVSEATVYWGLCRARLQVHVKEKKSHLSRKNIIDCWSFAKKYE